ncbi:MAG TPA: hypothetical protein VHY20_13010 [Pirellulales bacterium]|jgi:small-conductance mechanosensitive channel|nr:hypothetical protein [Pirellulales bacterium]
MKPKTDREKLLLLALPTILILVFYAYKLSDLNGRSKAAENGLAAAKKSQPVPAQVAAQQKQIAELNQQLADAEKKTKEQETAWQKLQTARSTGTTGRVEAIERLTTLLNENKLRLRDCEPADASGGNGAQTKLPKELERVATLLAENRPELKPQLWRVRFSGSYVNVLLALESLRVSEPLAIPIHVQMGEAKLTTQERSWTLHLWI